MHQGRLYLQLSQEDRSTTTTPQDQKEIAMNIMEFLRGAVDSLVAQANSEQGLSDVAAQNALSNMETAIREGIAQELEELVTAGAVPKMHGIPSSITAPQSIPQLQQDIMRGAANVVRGKNPATEYDWEQQGERMKAMTTLRQIREDRAADLFPMPADADLQRKFDDRQDRLREWND